MPGISSHVLSMLLLIIISVMGTTCTCNLSLPPWASIMPGKDHGKCTSGKCPTQEVKRGGPKWNNLPESLRHETKLEPFKKNLKTYLF